jgi:methylated-DNA-[protein]-cysteine S-methyltransferase
MAKRTFADRCYEALTRVPRGRVTTYRELALFLGSRAYRAVGNAMHINPYAPQVPCHRVVRSDGAAGGFARGTGEKMKLLRAEGIQFSNGRIVDFEKRLFRFPKQRRTG